MEGGRWDGGKRRIRGRIRGGRRRVLGRGGWSGGWQGWWSGRWEGGRRAGEHEVWRMGRVGRMPVGECVLVRVWL